MSIPTHPNTLAGHLLSELAIDPNSPAHLTHASMAGLGQDFVRGDAAADPRGNRTPVWSRSHQIGSGCP